MRGLTFVLAILVAMLAVGVGASLLEKRAERNALRAFRARRSDNAKCTDYGFVTRGIRRGMTYDEVSRQLSGESDQRFLVKSESADEPTYALVRFWYGGAAFYPISDWEKGYVTEEYIVHFDASGGATRIEYRVFFHGAQTLEVDLVERAIVGQLNLPWRSSDCLSAPD